MVLALNPTTVMPDLPADVRDVFVNLLKSKGSMLLREKKKGVPASLLREKIAFDIGKLVMGEVTGQCSEVAVFHSK